METKERDVGRNGANVQRRKLEQRAERFDNCRRQDTNCNQNDEDYEVEPRPSLAVTSFGETLSRGLIPVHLHLLEEGPHQD